MTTYSPESQMNFIVQWFKSWSDFQKEDFVGILGQKIIAASTTDSAINGLVNGIRGLDASGRPPSLFTCQVKLFNEWWETWTETDRQKMTETFKEADSVFWQLVESELQGTRKILNEDFMIVTVSSTSENVMPNGNSKVSGVSPVPPPVFNVKQIVVEDKGISVLANNEIHGGADNGQDEQELPSSAIEREDQEITTNGGESNEDSSNRIATAV